MTILFGGRSIHQSSFERPLSSLPKMAIVERFNCNHNNFNDNNNNVIMTIIMIMMMIIMMMMMMMM